MKGLKEYLRKFPTFWSVIWGIFGAIYIILSLIYASYLRNVSNSWQQFLFNLFMGIFWSLMCFTTLIYGHRLKNRYVKHPENDSCDYCGLRIEKQTTKSILYFKAILCKKCHKYHYLLFLMIYESVITIFLFLFLYTIPPSLQVGDVLMYLIGLIVLSITIPIMFLASYLYYY